MSRIYQAVAASSPSTEQGSYIYAILPTIETGLAAITSANELLALDRQNLSTSPVLRFQGVPPSVSCLVSGDDIGATLLCSGGRGSVAIFDVRSQQKAGQFEIGKATTALACRGDQIAVGTELSTQTHQAIVGIWDRRQYRQLWQSTENNDDITALDFHPTKHNVLLSGGDDGQVSIFDTSIAEEDDSLLQGVNHGPIHKAGFLGEHRFYALSSDQNLAIYPLSTPDDNEDPPPTVLGDLRPHLECEYVIDVLATEGGYAVAAGCNINDPHVDIVELRHATSLDKSPRLKSKSRYTLEGGHGEEIVRSIFADEQNGAIFTGGEDGQIKAFRLAEGMAKEMSSAKISRSKTGLEARYKPY